MTEAGPAPSGSPAGTNASTGASWSEFRGTPARVRGYLVACGVAALVGPLLLRHLSAGSPTMPPWITAGVLVLISVLNVEISRRLSGGLERTHQPHKALSAWAFSSVLLLPTPWLLAVVPLTYAHARWRGLRLPLWKWVGSASYLVLAGLAAAAVRHVLFGNEANWMLGDGGRGFLTMLAAAAAFLLTESLLFAGTAVLNRAEDEVWLRRTLTSPGFYGTELAVLLIGGLLAALWTGGPWFVLLLVPIYGLAQQAALHDPLRERVAAATELAAKNQELEAANEFKIDLLGMLGHEIGNPLTAIMGYSQVGAEALEEGDTAYAGRSFEVIEANALRIRSVVHEILTTVTSESGVLTAQPETCLLEPALRAAASHECDVPPVVDCPEGLAAWVQRSHLEQILANLLNNAAKYAGGATRLSAAPAADGQVEVLVADDGPGVPAAFRDQLFTRFSRDTGTARSVIGTGLGLFISRELARANRSEVVYRDGDPSGAVFAITLPRAD